MLNQKSMLSPLIKKTIVISLREDSIRRDHIRKHFFDIGIRAFDFFEAVSYDTEEVQDFYKNGLVKKYPNCFRCDQEVCQCKNNVLIPQQVANWISFIKVWKALENENGLFLVCEDDVIFDQNAISLLNEALEKLDTSSENILMRLVASGQKPDKVLDPNVPLRFIDKVAMSNAAYIASGSMFRYLVQSFKKIETTSDIWVHKEIAAHKDVNSITVAPLIGTDLSFNKEYAKFLSRIHPKGIDEKDLKRKGKHFMRANSIDEYERYYRHWTCDI